jgi:hypothetical protein
MVALLDKTTSDRVQQIRGNPGIVKEGVHQVQKAVAFIVRIGVDKAIRIV